MKKRFWRIIGGIGLGGITLYYPIFFIWLSGQILPPSTRFRFTDFLWVVGCSVVFSGLLFLGCKKLKLPQGLTYLMQVVLWLEVLLLITLLQAFEVAHG